MSRALGWFKTHEVDEATGVTACGRRAFTVWPSFPRMVMPPVPSFWPVDCRKCVARAWWLEGGQP